VRRQRHHVLKRTASFAIVTVLLIPLNRIAETQVRAGAYSYTTTGCLQGTNGPGRAFYLTDKHCTAFSSYPYLEIDIRQWPVPIGKAITIGPDNWAFRCLSSREGCAQAVSGTVVFDHSPDPTEPTDHAIRSTGKYELKFQAGQIESGRFEVTCSVPCA
jgi:hypothetical protein